MGFYLFTFLPFEGSGFKGSEVQGLDVKWTVGADLRSACDSGVGRPEGWGQKLSQAVQARAKRSREALEQTDGAALKLSRCWLEPI